MRRVSSIILGLSLVLAACSPGDGAQEATTTTEASGPTTTSDAPDQTTTTVADVTTTTVARASDGASCIEGTWQLSPEIFVQVMEDAAEGQADLGDAEIIPSDGSYTIVMSSDGTFTGEREGWGFSVVTADGTFDILVNGSEQGSWSADDTTVTVTITSSDVTVSATAEVDGQTIDLPQSPVEVPEAIAESSSYTCDGDRLAVTSDGVTVTLERA